MSMERLIELRDIFEDNHDLIEKNHLELAVLGAILEAGEIPVKNFNARTKSEVDGSLIEKGSFQGELMLTDRRVLFMTRENKRSQVFEIRYEEIDDFFIDVNERDKTDGIIVVVAEGAYYSFSGLMRFGLSKWADYVHERLNKF